MSEPIYRATVVFCLVVVSVAAVGWKVSARQADAMHRLEARLDAIDRGGASGPAAPTIPASLPKMMDFGKGECKSCQRMEAIIDGLREGYAGQAVFEIVDITADKQATEAYKLRVIPTQVFVDAEGDQVFRHEGVLERDAIIEQFTKMGVTPPDGPT